MHGICYKLDKTTEFVHTIYLQIQLKIKTYFVKDQADVIYIYEITLIKQSFMVTE